MARKIQPRFVESEWHFLSVGQYKGSANVVAKRSDDLQQLHAALLGRSY
jgi:hypothetical protein